MVNIIERILIGLGFDREFILKAKVAGILHDIGVLEGKDGHALRGYFRVLDYFDRNDIDFEGKEQVIDAVKLHSDGFETDNVIALVLILADKLDVCKTRVAVSGKKVVGMSS